MQLPQTNLQTGKGHGGFMDPDSIVNQIGVKKNMVVSEFGSGSGFFSMIIAQKVGSSGKVHALDILESSLDSVRSKAKAGNLGNIDTIHTNLEVVGSSGLADRSQDIVLVANVLFQSRKKTEIIREAHRVVKHDGVLVVIDWAKGSGGFGPPDELRTDDISMQSLVVKEGFIFDHNINAGRFHFGLLFKKS